MTSAKIKIFILLVCSATLAFSDQMENLESGKCKFGTNDLVLWGMSYASCLRECRARTACTSINVNQKAGVCRLNFDANIPKVSCGMYVYSEKSNWKQKTICDRQNCGDAFNVKTKSNCTCVIEECTKLAQPANCILMGNGRLIGHKVIYVHSNTQNRNVRHRRCMPTGVWSGEPINCTGPFIPDPPPTRSTTEPNHTIEPTAPTEASTQPGPYWSVSSTKSSTVTPRDPSTSTVSQPQTLSSESTEATSSTEPNAPTKSSAPTKAVTTTAQTKPTALSTSSDTRTPSQTPKQKKTSTDAERSTSTYTTQMTSTTTETVVIWDTFLEIYNSSCKLGEACGSRSDLECRLHRCQCRASLVLDISNRACVQECPMPTNPASQRYGSTYQEYENVEINDPGNLMARPEVLDITLLVDAQAAINDRFQTCIRDSDCRATDGVVKGQKITVTNYYGEGQFEIGHPIFDFVYAGLYVRDCAEQHFV